MQANASIPTAEAAKILQVNRSTLTRWMHAGRLTPVVQAPGVRGAILFDRAEVEALAAERAS